MSKDELKTVHKLKTWKPFFQDVINGKKTFELRENDRDFKHGDTLLLQEYIPEKGYTGREHEVVITYKFNGGVFGLDIKYCILGFTRPTENVSEEEIDNIIHDYTTIIFGGSDRWLRDERGIKYIREDIVKRMLKDGTTQSKQSQPTERMGEALDGLLDSIKNHNKEQGCKIGDRLNDAINDAERALTNYDRK